jgi:hypothetical protein
LDLGKDCIGYGENLFEGIGVAKKGGGKRVAKSTLESKESFKQILGIAVAQGQKKILLAVKLRLELYT